MDATRTTTRIARAAHGTGAVHPDLQAADAAAAAGSASGSESGRTSALASAPAPAAASASAPASASADIRPPRRVVIMQPYMLPYRGYMGLIRRCDEFVLFDDVQFCHKWQQRNCIPDGRGGKEWITIPVVSRRPSRQRICDVVIADDPTWPQRLLGRVRHIYGRHPCFDSVFPGLQQILCSGRPRLIDLLVPLLQWSTEAMGLRAPVWRQSSEFDVADIERSERLLEICRRLGASEYISGPAARVYLRTDLFADAGVAVTWHEETYPPYPQFGTQPFDPFVSCLDLLMNHGVRSHRYLEPCAPDAATDLLRRAQP